MRKTVVKRLRRNLALAFVNNKLNFSVFKRVFRKLKKDYTRGVVPHSLTRSWPLLPPSSATPTA